MTQDPTTLLSARISALVEAAPIADSAKFADAALPLLVEANNAIAALVEAIDTEHNWAIGTAEHNHARSALYRLAREMGGRRF